MAAQDGVLRQEGLLRAGSWQVQGEAMLLKTASDIVLQMAIHQGPKQHRLAVEGGGEGGKTNSVDSSSTAAGQQPTDLLLDSATAGLLPPLRQISLDVITATELNRSKGLAASGERQNSIFQDVFEQLAGKDDLPPLQAGQLYTLPSMQFLESMLNDFDKSGSNSATAMNSLHISGPLDLPGDAFDLPEFSHRGADPQPATSAALRPMPFDQQAAAVAAQSQAYYARGGGSASYTGFVPTGGSAPAALQAQIAPSMHSSSNGSLTLQASMKAHSTYESHMAQAGMVAPAHTHHHHLLLMQQQQAAVVAAAAAAVHRAAPAAMAASQGVRQPAVPQPAQPRATPRRTSQAYADFDYEEAEVSLQTSKSGRVRKVASFTGVKRRLDIANGGGTTASESRGSRGSVGGADVSSGEVGSRGSVGARKAAGGGAKGRKGRRTVCLNCGCHQTPQWRCGPLGSRTLCNACGVRFKKDLPLNCWPIRDGMVLPPGAMLPPGFVVPPGITIHTQPAEIE